MPPYGGGVTPTQSRCLQAVASLAEARGYPPTVQEVAEETDRHYSSVHGVLVSLERQGLIARDYATARSMRLTDAGRMALQEQG